MHASEAPRGSVTFSIEFDQNYRDWIVDVNEPILVSLGTHHYSLAEPHPLRLRADIKINNLLGVLTDRSLVDLAARTREIDDDLWDLSRAEPDL